MFIINIILYIAITVSFNESTYIVNENTGSVRLALVLSKPLSNDITVEVIDAVDTATGES